MSTKREGRKPPAGGESQDICRVDGWKSTEYRSLKHDVAQRRQLRGAESLLRSTGNAPGAAIWRAPTEPLWKTPQCELLSMRHGVSAM